MKDYTWYTEVLKNRKNNLDYILEKKKLDITESICEIMKNSGLTRKQLANKMNTSSAAITKFLNGDANFTLKTLIKFSLCLNRDFIFSFKEKRETHFESYKYFILDNAADANLFVGRLSTFSEFKDDLNKQPSDQLKTLWQAENEDSTYRRNECAA